MCVVSFAFLVLDASFEYVMLARPLPGPVEQDAGIRTRADCSRMEGLLTPQPPTVWISSQITPKLNLHTQPK